jgi:hypothetical protein
MGCEFYFKEKYPMLNFELLNSDEKNLALDVQRYIQEDINYGIGRLKFKPQKEKEKQNQKSQVVETFEQYPNVKIDYDDTIGIPARVPKCYKGKSIAGRYISESKFLVKLDIPEELLNEHTISIFSIALTHFKEMDYLHFNRLAIIETIIFTSLIYIELHDHISDNPFDSDDNVFLVEKISNICEFLYGYPTYLVLDIFMLRMDEFADYPVNYNYYKNAAYLLNRHIQYEHNYLEFSFAKFPIEKINEDINEYNKKQISEIFKNTKKLVVELYL